jgi:hypothetical protein
VIPCRQGSSILKASREKARYTVDMMTFVYWRGDIARRFAATLAARARAGARVRLLLDGFGSRLIEKDLLDDMDRAGVEVAWFRDRFIEHRASGDATVQVVRGSASFDRAERTPAPPRGALVSGAERQRVRVHQAPPTGSLRPEPTWIHPHRHTHADRRAPRTGSRHGPAAGEGSAVPAGSC